MAPSRVPWPGVQGAAAHGHSLDELCQFGEVQGWEVPLAGGRAFSGKKQKPLASLGPCLSLNPLKMDAERRP